jgi:nitrite reductase/ring-hydroxylating ferredoxin subunit
LKSKWVYAARADEVPPGESKVVTHEGEEIVLFNVDGTFYATGNRCPHAAGPLEHAWIENGRIQCPWHGWSFPLDPDHAPNDALPRYRTRVHDAAVYVAYPAVEVDKSWK